MKTINIFLLLCLIWHTATAEGGPRRFWRKASRRSQTCFEGSQWHYRPDGMHRRKLLPRTAVCFSTSAGFLYWYSGRFFCHMNGYFHSVIPAPGLLLSQLPAHCNRYAFRGADYFFLHGSCFMAVPGGFRCIPPPVGIRLYNLPLEEIQFHAGDRGEVLFGNQIWQETDSPNGKCYELTGFMPD
jgi:hypothetical protein